MTESVRNATVLVTGAAGFVGGHLVSELLAENTVIALDHFRTHDRERIPDGAVVVEADVRDDDALREAAEGVDVIFHLAAMGGDRTRAQPQLAHEVNVESTLSVLDLVRERDARVVVPTSASIYGNAPALPIDESAEMAPVTPYGVQELVSDYYTRLWADLYGVETVVLRYFNLYGADVDGELCGLVGTFLDQLERDGAITVYGDGSQTRDFVHVSDVVQATLRAATTRHVGEAFNVGSGKRLSVETLARMVRDRVDPEAPIVFESGNASAIGDSQADITKARKLLAYEPSMTLEDCLRERMLPA